MLLSSTATRVCAVRPTQQARLVSVRPSVSRIRTRASTGPPQIDADELSQKAQAAWSDTATTLKVITRVLSFEGVVVAYDACTAPMPQLCSWHSGTDVLRSLPDCT